MTRIPTEAAFDLIVIGAGINGAGIARDSAMRGLKVLLLDKGDISSGTTSASTRLIHGGLRYLEHGELGLVRESLREREILFRVAPHLVKPLSILIPIYKNRHRSRMMIRAGMIAYDLLSLGKSLPRHQMLSSSQTLEILPGLEREGLLGSAVYHDGHVEFPERLVLENVLSAIEGGATVLTYARVDRLSVAAGQIRGVAFTDLLSGACHIAKATIVLNAAGPWIDEVLQETNPVARLIGGTKGSHIVVSPFPGAPDVALYVEAESDQRPFFVIPWNGNYLIGTTDIRYEGDLDEVEIEESEIEYLLSETNNVFPHAKLQHSSILFSYSGVRPLAYVARADEQSITRRHFLREHEKCGGLVSVVGGKLTTYRSLAEEAVDLIGRKLGRQLRPCVTASAPLPGAVGSEASCEKFPAQSKVCAVTIDRLKRIYGTRANEVLSLVETDPLLAESFDRETGAIAAEVIHSFKNELAQTLSDCLLRRTMVGVNSTCGMGAVENAAEIAKKHLGWTDRRAHEEVTRFRKSIV